MRPAPAARSAHVGAAALVGSALLAGCASLPPARTHTCDATPPPPIQLSEDGRTARMRLDVLTYNIEGLRWPARTGRERPLREIGERLAALRAAGEGPDVVLFQEVFSEAAAQAVDAAGYPAQVAGPERTARRRLPKAGSVPGRRTWTRGELGLRLTSGGLAIASRYPISAQAQEPFSKRGCAGLDCLSNKGVLFARLAIPGAPTGVDVFNTHMNSRKASRAPRSRTQDAHAIQTAELLLALAAYRHPGNPAILGGDFNMRGSEARFGVFDTLLPLSLVHRHCLDQPDSCEVAASWDGDAPWMDTQDLQLFDDGRGMTVRPVRVEAMFDGRPESPALSDHDGLRVVYELTWPVGAEASAGAGACPPGGMKLTQPSLFGIGGT